MATQQIVTKGGDPLIVRLLSDLGLLSSSQAEERQRALTNSPNAPEKGLILAELADERVIAQAHARHLGIPWSHMDDDADPPEVVSTSLDGEIHLLGTVEEVAGACKEIAYRISEAVCRKHMVAPIHVESGQLTLACLNPAAFMAIEEVRMRAGCIIRPQATTLSLLSAVTVAIFGERDMVSEIAAENTADDGDDDGEGGTILDLDRPVPQDKDSQVVRIVNVILGHAIDDGASDIHLEPYEGSVRVRYRIDGKMLETTPPPKHLFVPAISRLKILSKMDIAEKRIPQDGAIALKQGSKRTDLRVSTVPTVYGEKMCIRILEKEGIPDRLEALGFSERQARDFLSAAESPHGLMFVTGPTGSGKSTTLYCCLNLINEPTQNIVTVEDPVEYKFHGLNQVHVRSNVGLTFATALRAFLRQDPDKIMVGEVRDQETAEICMRAALTGHLVLSTLHTNSSLEVINRLVDMGIEPFLLGPALRLVEAQRLCRRLCTECKVPYELPEDVAERHDLEAGVTLYRPPHEGEMEKPCERCKGNGYKGRVGLYEVVPIVDKLKELIGQGASMSVLRAAAKAEGLLFLEDDARLKLLQGHTGLDEVSEYIQVNV